MNAKRKRSRRRDATGVPSTESTRPGVAPINSNTRTDNHADTGASSSDDEGRDEFPDRFEHSIEWHDDYGWILRVESGCPHCGMDSIFNGTIKVSSQFVSYERDGEAVLLGQDDVMQVQVEYLTCGHCHRVVVDTRGKRAPDWRNS